MPIRVECHTCHAKFTAPDKAAGKSLPCPKCGAKIAVQSAAAVEPLPVELVADFAEPDEPVNLLDTRPPVPRDPEFPVAAVASPPAARGREITSAIAAFLTALVWVACLVDLAMSYSEYRVGLVRAESAIQQIAFAADGCFKIVVAYIACRAIDRLIHCGR